MIIINQLILSVNVLIERLGQGWLTEKTNFS